MLRLNNVKRFHIFAPSAKNVSRCSNGIAVMTTKAFVAINRICSRNYYRATDTRYQYSRDKNSYRSSAISLAWWVRLRLDCYVTVFLAMT